MGFNWAFDASKVEEPFPLIPIGDYRCRIKSVEETQSKSMNDMYVITLNISGQRGTLKYWLTLLPDNVEMTNTNLDRLWNSFAIPVGTMDSTLWVGKVGACRVKHEQYDGEPRAKISYFIERKKQDKLPAWVEKSSGGASAPAAYADPSWAADAPNDAPPFDTGDLPL